MPRSSASGRAEPEHLARRERDVLQHGHVREQVEALEDDADVARAERRGRCPRPLTRSPSRRISPPSIGLQRVDAPQQRRLATARRTDEAHDLVLVDVEVMPRSTGLAPKCLVYVDQFEEGHDLAARPASWPAVG